MFNDYIIVDLTNREVVPEVDVVQGDTNRGVILSTNLTSNEYYGATAVAYVKKPDGTKVLNNATILSGGEIQVPFSQQMLAAVGVSELQVEVIKDSARISTFVINMRVAPSIIDEGAIESTDEFGALEEALSQAGDISAIRNTANTALANANTALGRANTALNTANALDNELTVQSTTLTHSILSEPITLFKYGKIVVATAIGDIQNVTGGTGYTITIPTGYRPKTGTYFYEVTTNYNASVVVQTRVYNSSFLIYPYQTATAATYKLNMTWVTD